MCGVVVVGGLFVEMWLCVVGCVGVLVGVGGGVRGGKGGGCGVGEGGERDTRAQAELRGNRWFLPTRKRFQEVGVRHAANASAWPCPPRAHAEDQREARGGVAGRALDRPGRGAAGRGIANGSVIRRETTASRLKSARSPPD